MFYCAIQPTSRLMNCNSLSGWIKNFLQINLDMN